ncbi:hypothetical protein IQ268_20190 [Oculatella sp. LEGE 06141]|uniref:hypothetical protein n=1 Tax=Oculatella sp. LEGE 06141 TaxID=1828648 RepID=UPI0018829B9B|nr:hypothetical protein [Oculatella sp. LEGE 06141]MBE9180883.1 hypothetical protein [Oculatella sp. LEGE 06141]
MTSVLLSHPGEANSPAACHPPTQPQANRDTLKHVLIGSPRAIRQTIHLLHNLRYAEAGLWSPLIAIPTQQLILTPHPGEMMSLLTRSIRFE